MYYVSHKYNTYGGEMEVLHGFETITKALKYINSNLNYIIEGEPLPFKLIKGDDIGLEVYDKEKFLVKSIKTVGHDSAKSSSPNSDT